MVTVSFSDMNKDTGRDRFLCPEIWYNPRGTLIPAETGVFERQQINRAGHDRLKQARHKLMAIMWQQCQGRNSQDRSWEAFRRLHRIEEGIDYVTPAEMDETACVDTPRAPSSTHPMPGKDFIEAEVTPEEGVMNIDQDIKDPLGDSDQRSTDSAKTSYAAEDVTSRSEM